MKHDVRIRPAVLSDFERIVEIENSCFPHELAYSRGQLRHLLLHAHSTVLVETYKRHLRGFVIVLYKTGTSVAGIETINVDPSYQNQGIGARLLTAAENDVRSRGMKKIRLEVATSNRAAIQLYKRAGFTILSLLPRYYLYDHAGSRDAYRMIKELA